MKKEFCTNLVNNSNLVYEKTKSTLEGLTSIISAVTGKSCIFDMLYDGSVVLIYDNERVMCSNFTKTVECLAHKLNDIMESED